jgi:hypothetical protein
MRSCFQDSGYNYLTGSDLTFLVAGYVIPECFQPESSHTAHSPDTGFRRYDGLKMLRNFCPDT